MKRTSFIPLLICLLLSNISNADIRIEGVVTRLFSFTNIAKYPAYKFYFIHQGYHYNQGYQADVPDTVAVENNKRYESASRGNVKTNLLARDANGNWIKASTELGGEANAGPQVKNIVDVYEIISIKDGIILLKKIREISLYKNGKEKSKKASTGFFSFISNDTFSGGLTIFSLVALASLLALFIIKKRKQSYRFVTTSAV